MNKFAFLGSTITNDNTLDSELDARIGKKPSTFGRVWDNRHQSIKLKEVFMRLSCMEVNVGQLIEGRNTV